MAQVSIESVMEAADEITPASPISPVSSSSPSPPSPLSRSASNAGSPDGVKLKGRRKLLLGLQRNFSSSSLGKQNRAGSPGYRSTGLGSMSCVSLSSGSSGSPYFVSSSYSSELSAGYSTAPTSVPSTPGPDDEKARFKIVGAESCPGSVALPSDLRPVSRPGAAGLPEIEEDYFSRPVQKARKKIQRRPNFNFWVDMPPELRIYIMSFLQPREVVRCSSVSRSWHDMCFDGQLWSQLDTSDFYRDIPADALVNIITSAGPFVRDLNLRGCVQLRDKWNSKNLYDACRNLENFSLEGCRIDRTSIHCFLLQNNRLRHVNLSGLAGATNSAMKIIAQSCPKLEELNISWCNNIDTRGLRRVVESCPNLRDLRAGEVSGWDDVEFMNELFKRNSLERLVLMNCDTLNDDSLAALVAGIDPEIDVLTGRPIVPPRRLKHLDLTRCRGVTDKGIESLAYALPELEGLNLSKCHTLTDAALTTLFPTLSNLSHLDLEELAELTNESLKSLAASPCTGHMKHLSISYCENLGDTGMLPILKHCTRLASLDMDNTRISDLVLTEAAALVRSRNRLARGLSAHERPDVGLRIVAYDCANVTWTGVREILSRNAEAHRPFNGQPTFPREIITLKAFYNWQPTVEEHTRRVLRGDWAAAARLERKWADYMILAEEAGVTGRRRHRRRAREARLIHEDEEEGAGAVTVGGGRRRRARSGPGGCAIM